VVKTDRRGNRLVEVDGRRRVEFKDTREIELDPADLDWLNYQDRK
jgi:hypothetical protein